MRTSRNTIERRFGFERLENRVLLAGDVTAAVVAGTLELDGDSSGNALQIWKVGTDTWKVQGLGTAINGSNSVFIAAGVTNGISAALDAGNNFLKVFNGQLTGGLSVSALD